MFYQIFIELQDACQSAGKKVNGGTVVMQMTVNFTPVLSQTVLSTYQMSKEIISCCLNEIKKWMQGCHFACQ